MNSRIIDQFGSDTQLWHPSTATLAPASDVLANKVIVLYFSAHWCPVSKTKTFVFVSFNAVNRCTALVVYGLQ